MDSSSAETQLLASQDKPYSKLSFEEKLDIVKIITKAAIPNIFTSIGLLLKDVISMSFIGHLNDPSMFAAFGFGIAWCNGFAFAIIFGFAAGFGTFASQAYGAKNYRRLGLLYQKVFAVISIAIIFMYALLWFTTPILLSMGYNELLANQVGLVAKSLMINILVYPFFEVTKFYLVAQNIFNIPAYIIGITGTLHIFWCHLFINELEYGLVGMAMARTITDASSATLILLYAKYRNPNPESWIPWTTECLEDLWGFSKDILSHGSSIYMEWITFEISTLITGHLGDMSVLAAHAAALNFLGLNFNVPFGFTLATSTLVANAAGEGSVQKAKSYTIIGLGLLTVVILVLDNIVLIFRNQISGFYTGEAGVKSAMATILVIYYFGMHPDILSNACGFLLRGLGQDRFVLRSYIFSYYCIALVLALISTSFMGAGFRGVWVSLVIGFYVLTGICFYKLYYLDWNQVVSKVKNDVTELEMNDLKRLEDAVS